MEGEDEGRRGLDRRNEGELIENEGEGRECKIVKNRNIEWKKIGKMGKEKGREKLSGKIIVKNKEEIVNGEELLENMNIEGDIKIEEKGEEDNINGREKRIIEINEGIMKGEKGGIGEEKMKGLNMEMIEKIWNLKDKVKLKKRVKGIGRKRMILEVRMSKGFRERIKMRIKELEKRRNEEDEGYEEFVVMNG